MARKTVANTKLEAERKKKDAERKRLKRLEIKNDPEKKAIEKEKERQRYQRRKEDGKLKSIKDMNRRDQKVQRQKWVNARRKYVSKQKLNAETDHFLQDNSPPLSPEGGTEQRERNIEETPNQPSTSSHQKRSGRKRRQRNTMRTFNALVKERKLRARETQLKEKYKKKYYRLKQQKELIGSPSPNKIVEKTLAKGEKEVKRKLLFLEVLKKQVKENQNDLSERDRNVLAKSLTGSTVRKYKKIQEMNCLVSKHLQNKISKFSKERNPMILRRKLKLNSLFARLKNTVAAFFDDDENALPSPEKNATITKKGVMKQKRYLTDSMSNLHKKFEKTSNVKVSYTTFLRMKPFYIYERKIKDRDTCRCIKHANFEFLIQKMHRLGITKCSSLSAFLEQMCCNKNNQDCSNRTCKECMDTFRTETLLVNISQELADSQTFYYEWELCKQNYTNKNNEVCTTKITSKNRKYIKVKDLIKKVETEIPEFFKHVFRASHQIRTIKEIKNSLKPNETSIYCDFSENYTLKYSEEVQSVHFGGSQQQLSLHTGAFYYNENGDIKHQSFGTLSKNTRHDPVGIWAHLTPVLKLIKETVPNADTIYFNSDGPTSQYRNRTNIFMSNTIPLQFGFTTIIWNYFEAGHGKSVADAIGSTIKNNADKVVCRGKDVASINELVGNLMSLKTRIYVIEDQNMNEVQSVVPKVLKPIPKCLKIHQIVSRERKMVIRKISCTRCSRKLETCEECQIEGATKIIQIERILLSKIKTEDKEKSKTSELQENKMLLKIKLPMKRKKCILYINIGNKDLGSTSFVVFWFNFKDYWFEF